MSAVVFALAAAIIVIFDSNTRLFADYADGYRTEQALTLPDAVRVWRQDAWRQDDFLAQIRLGDLYSANQSFAPGESSKNASFLDPVEAYVWYYMALRPGHDYRADDNANSYDTLYNIRTNALNNAQVIYYALTFEQRLDARARILYVLSSRGAEGFITLGRIHASGIDPGITRSDRQYIRLCMRSAWDHWYSSWLWWLWSAVTGSPYPHYPVWKWVSNDQANKDASLYSYYCDGAEIPLEPDPNPLLTSVGSSMGGGTLALNSGGGPGNLPVTPVGSVSIGADPRSSQSGGGNSAPMPTVNAGGNFSGAGAPPSGYSGSGGAGSTMSGFGNSYSGASSGGFGLSGIPVPSVFVANDSEALTYYQIALTLGHPLANAYATAQRAAIKSYNSDAGRIIADAEKRARFWSPPFEYYPGATAGGMPHSDESMPTLEERIALNRIRELPLRAVMEALDFRGYAKRGVPCGPPPICFRRAVQQFQNAMGFEPTGFLAPSQTVRLIQMAAVDGDAIAQDRLGIMYTKGIGVPQNFARAEKWFIKSANQRFPDALYNLYVLYKVGPNGIEPDEHKAVSYSAQAMAAGYNRTLCELQDLLNQADDAGHDHPEGARR